MPRTRSEIVDKVTARAHTLFKQGWLPKEITLPAFRELGRELGYSVAAKHCAADFSEWLYDLSWSDMRKADDGGSYFVGQPLVLETETSPDPHADGDFQKLVQARAVVRVWIAKVPDVQAHVGICKKQIRCFLGTQPDDTYIFMVYDGQGKPAYFACFSACDI